ncbi:MAG: hypothetical protein WCB46_11635 [Methanoregula sp.]
MSTDILCDTTVTGIISIKSDWVRSPSSRSRIWQLSAGFPTRPCSAISGVMPKTGWSRGVYLPILPCCQYSFREDFSKAFGQEQQPVHLAILDPGSFPVTELTAVEKFRNLMTELMRKVSGRYGKGGRYQRQGRKPDNTTPIAALLEQSRKPDSMDSDHQ